MFKTFMLTSEVIARRIPLLTGEWAMLPGTLFSTDRRESERMVSEKVAALGEGMVEAVFATAKLQIATGAMMMTGNTQGLARMSRLAPKRVARAFAGPGQKKLRANAKRLRNT